MNNIKENLQKNIEDILQYDPNSAVESIVKTVFETILKSERQEFLANSEIPNKGNGYYERMARSINQYFKLSVPRDRLGLFKPVFLDAIRNQENQMQDLAFQMYGKGLSTRDIQQIFKDIYGKDMSPTSVSNITNSFTEVRNSWLKRPIDNFYYFIFIDALWIPVRRDTVSKEAFYIVMGLRTDLKRDVLGVYNIPIETAEGWQTVFKDLKERGLEKTLMFIADGLQGLGCIVKQEFPGVKFQRCLVHKIRNIILRARTNDKKELVDDFHKVFVLEAAQYTKEEGIRNLAAFINKWKKIYPHLSTKFKDEDLDSYFAYLDFPYHIHRMIYTTNWIERLNKEIRRTQNIRNSFPSLDSAMNLICAHLMDYERQTLKYPITSFLRVQDTLESMLFSCPQTHKT
jgi:putative transposase